MRKQLRYSPPWHDTHIIGIAGSSGSGKTSVAAKLVNLLNLPWVVILSMDSFYKELSPTQSEQAFKNNFDFDAPDAIDFDILIEKLKDLKNGRKAEIPIYSFEKHQRVPNKTTTIYSCHVLILEGIFALYDPRVLELLDMKIFVDTDSDICLARRLARDVKYRGRDVRGALQQWHTFVKPNFELYVRPQMKNADVAIPRGIDNIIAINLIVKHIARALTIKSDSHRKKLEELGKETSHEPLSSRVCILEETPQIKGIHTILQDTRTPREDFIFYFDRLSALIIERALDHIEYSPTTVTTPYGYEYHGLAINQQVCAVIVLRSGGVFETGLKRVVPDCTLGRLLLQTNVRTGEPELHYLKMPPRIANQQVLVFDPQIATGAAALMTVSVLKDHGVAEDKIVFVTYIANPIGLRRLNAVFPDIRVVVAERTEEWTTKRWVDKVYFGC